MEIKLLVLGCYYGWLLYNLQDTTFQRGGNSLKTFWLWKPLEITILELLVPLTLKKLHTFRDGLVRITMKDSIILKSMSLIPILPNFTVRRNSKINFNTTCTRTFRIRNKTILSHYSKSQMVVHAFSHFFVVI